MLQVGSWCGFRENLGSGHYDCVILRGQLFLGLKENSTKTSVFRCCYEMPEKSPSTAQQKENKSHMQDGDYINDVLLLVIHKNILAKSCGSKNYPCHSIKLMMVGKALAVTAIIFPIYSGLGEMTHILSLEYIHVLSICGIYIFMMTIFQLFMYLQKLLHKHHKWRCKYRVMSKCELIFCQDQKLNIIHVLGTKMIGGMQEDPRGSTSGHAQILVLETEPQLQ